jgi:hypothetical protein
VDFKLAFLLDYKNIKIVHNGIYVDNISVYLQPGKRTIIPITVPVIDSDISAHDFIVINAYFKDMLPFVDTFRYLFTKNDNNLLFPSPIYSPVSYVKTPAADETFTYLLKGKVSENGTDLFLSLKNSTSNSVNYIILLFQGLSIINSNAQIILPEYSEYELSMGFFKLRNTWALVVENPYVELEKDSKFIQRSVNTTAVFPYVY